MSRPYKKTIYKDVNPEIKICNFQYQTIKSMIFDLFYIPTNEAERMDIECADETRCNGTNSTKTPVVTQIEIGGEPVTTAIQFINGYAVIEGDIVIGKEEEIISMVDGPEGLIIVGDTKLWPDGVVNFMISDDLPDEDRVTDAIAHWEENTFIRFNEVQDVSQNHVFFEKGEKHCTSSIGMQGNGRQSISLSSGCNVGAVIHEIGHAVGLWHEHTRADRDEHVTINFKNIIAGHEHNFSKHINDGIIRGSYDYRSIMHYNRTAFGELDAQNSPKETITVLDPNAPTIGQTNGLSPGDISAVNFSYFPDRRIPCVPEVCGNADRYQLADVIDDVMKTPYTPNLVINGDYVTSERIIKTKLMLVNTGAKILFKFDEDPDINDPYKAIVVDTLEVNHADIGGDELTFSWDDNNEWDVIKALKGEDQTEIPGRNSGAGANGFHGFPGHKGRTKNSPSIFLFIKNLIVNNGEIDKLSFKFDLPGISGGNGGKGGKGGDGNKGSNGRDARNGPGPTCRRGQGKGGQGGSPGLGGRGGDAGCGGNGSNVYIYFDAQPMWGVMYRSTFVLNGFFEENPESGLGGSPGDAGAPGPGGDKGGRAGNCDYHHRYGGPEGVPNSTSGDLANWNLGPGSNSIPGQAGKEEYETLDEVSLLAFHDPYLP